MQSQILLLLALIAAPSAKYIDFREDHAIYISLIEVDHKDFGGNATIKIKVFANDMEDAIRNASNKTINFLDPSGCANGKAEVEDYFSRHFSYTIDGKATPLALAQCEPKGDAVWFYFRIDCPARWGQVEVKADFLMELFPTQSNVITIHHGDEKRFLRTTNSHPKEVVKF